MNRRFSSDSGQLGRSVHRIFLGSHLIDQAKFFRLPPGIDPAISQPSHPLRFHFPAFRHHGDELVIEIVDHLLQNDALRGGHRPFRRQHVLMRPALDFFAMHADFFEQFLIVRVRDIDADAAGDSAGIGVDPVAKSRNPVPAGSGDVTHRSDDRFAGAPEFFQFLAHFLGGGRTAARAVDAQDHGPDGFVVPSSLNLTDHRIHSVAIAQ